MPDLVKNKAQGAVSFTDIVLLSLFLLLTILVTYAWENRLSTVFLVFAALALVIYLFSNFTGFAGSFLDLKKPVWTISALLSIPVWIIINLIPSSPADLEFAEGNAIVQLFGQEFFNNITQVVVIGIAETIILVGFLLAVFASAQKGKQSKMQLGKKFKGKNAAWLVIFVATIGALMHYVINLQLANETFSFGFLMIHQFVSFYVFALVAVTLGLPAAISSHMVKNALVYASPGWFIALFIFFIVMDIISIRSAPNNAPKIVKSTLKI